MAAKEQDTPMERTPEAFAQWLRAAGAPEALIAATPLQPDYQGELEQAQWALKVAREDKASGFGLYAHITEYGWLVAEIRLMERVRDAWEAGISAEDSEPETKQDWYRAAALFDGRRG